MPKDQFVVSITEDGYARLFGPFRRKKAERIFDEEAARNGYNGNEWILEAKNAKVSDYE